MKGPFRRIGREKSTPVAQAASEASQVPVKWLEEFAKFDLEVVDTHTVRRLLTGLALSLPNSAAILATAASMFDSSGQIPPFVFQRLQQFDWKGTTSEQTTHLHIIRRYEVAFSLRQILKAWRLGLERHGLLSSQRISEVLSDVRGAQRTMYGSLRHLGLDPDAMDRTLDKPTDIVEGMLAMRSWQCLMSVLDEETIYREGLSQWDRAMMAEMSTIEGDLLQIGNPRAIWWDWSWLSHGLHDAKIKYSVLLAVLATHDDISEDGLTEFFVRMVSSTEVKPWTQSEMEGAFLSASHRAHCSKIDTAEERSAAILRKT